MTTYCLSCTSTSAFYNNSCYSTCPAVNLYISNQTCLLCDNICASCTGSSNNCTSCNLTSNNTHLLNNTCLSICPDFYYSNITTSDCLLCNSLNIGCTNCSSSTTCNSCDTGFLYFGVNSSCLNSTPTGYFNINGTLYSCNSSCNTCFNSSSNCTSCSNNLSLYLNECLITCPINITVSINNTCMSCAYPCNTCFNNTNTCLSCNLTSNLFLNSLTNTCVNSTSCPNSTFSDNTSLTCSTCNLSCLSCSGASTNCSICSPNYYLIQSSNTCSITCPNGTVPINITSGNIC